MFNLWPNDESEAFVYATTHSFQKSLSAQGCFAIGKNERWVLLTRQQLNAGHVICDPTIARSRLRKQVARRMRDAL